MKVRTDDPHWMAWAQRLRRWGLAPWVGVMLEAGEPLWVAGAPLFELLTSLWPSAEARSLSKLFLNEDARQRFVRWLQEGEA